MRDISARVSSPVVTARGRVVLAPGVGDPAGGVADGVGPACATVVGRSKESRTASMGSEDEAPATAAALPAASTPVFAAEPAVDKNSAAPITTPTAHTRPPCNPS